MAFAGKGRAGQDRGRVRVFSDLPVPDELIIFSHIAYTCYKIISYIFVSSFSFLFLFLLFFGCVSSASQRVSHFG